jgi:outer membrane protein assembly factor BamB
MPVLRPFLPAEQAWLVTLDAAPRAGGAMDAELVFIPLGPRPGDASAPESGTERIVALERDTGEERWTHPLSSAWPPVLAHGRLLVAASDGLHALDPVSGTPLWHVAMSGPVIAPPAVAGGLFIVLTATEGLVARRPDDGMAAWQLGLGVTEGPASMTAADDAIVLSLPGARVVSASLEGGRLLWERTLSGVLGAPALARDRVLVGSTDNYLYALDSKDGSFEWRYPAGADVVGAASAGDEVFFVALDNVLRALHRGSGNQQWKALLGTRPSAPPRVFDGTVIVSGFSPSLAAFAAATGTPLGMYAAPSDLVGPALVDPDPQPFRVAIVAITGDGRVTGLIPTGMMFREAAPAPLTTLPGRALTPDAAPGQNPP